MSVTKKSKDDMMYIDIKRSQLEFDDHGVFVKKIAAEVIDMRDEMIVQACIRAAREAGISDLYLLDKTFVLNAPTAKINPDVTADVLINGKKPREIFQALIQCRDGICDNCPYYDSYDCDDDIQRDAVKLITRIVTERDFARASVPRWRDAKRVLPSESGRYQTMIVCPVGSWVDIDYYDADRRKWVHKFGISDHEIEDSTEFVTHWMPLPAAVRVDKTSEEGIE